MLAAIFGDTVNYWIGSFIGPRVFHEKSKFFKKEYVNRTQKFFEKYGSMTIILARFVPVIRTFAPFLAGVGKMKYWKFLAYNVLGAILWVALYAFGGYYFGNIQFINMTTNGIEKIKIVTGKRHPGIRETVVDQTGVEKQVGGEVDSGTGLREKQGNRLLIAVDFIGVAFFDLMPEALLAINWPL